MEWFFMENEIRSPRKEPKFLFIGLKRDRKELLNELVIPVIIFSTIGGFYWAIRGSAGYGGSSGGAFAGIGWALAWFWLSYEPSEKKSRPYSSGWVVLALIIGIAIGGMHGYGQFMSWINGRFYIEYPDKYISINPMIGYLWLFQCGLVWGGIAGIFLGWCGSKEPTENKDWIFRVIFGAVGGLVGFLIAFLRPDFINPLYGTIDYSNCPECQRTLPTSQDSVIFFGIFLGLLFYEVVKKDWRNVMLALTMALGFGLAFSIFGFWHLLPNISDLPIDWWKNWEMSIGLVGGATIGVCYYLYNRPFNESELEFVRKQPYTLHRNAEKLVGVYLTLTIAIGWSIINGIGGFVENFQHNSCLILIISIPSISILLVFLFIAYRKNSRNLYKLNDGRNNIKKPLELFLVFHLVLIILGFMVTFNSAMSFASWFLISLYSIFLIISLFAIIIRIKVK